MIAADHDRRLELAPRDHFVERETGAVPLAQAQPADPRRQTLKSDPLGCEIEPSMQPCVVGKELLYLAISSMNVLRVAGQCSPPERPFALAKQRPDVRGYESGESECVLHAGIERHLTDIVAVVDCRNALRVKFEHRFYMCGDRARRRGNELRVPCGIGLRRPPAFDRPTGR